MVASRLQFSYIRTNRSAMRRLVSMLQPPPGPSPGFSLGYQTKIHLVMAAIRLQSSCKWTKRRATWSYVALLPWQYCLSTCQQAYSRPPSHWPSPPYDDFIPSGLRSLYRCPLRGLPIAPARRGNGPCKWLRSWDYKSIVESRPWSHLGTWLLSACRSSQFGSW